MKYFLTIFTLFACLSLQAQHQVTGTVTDAGTGETLIGVSISVKEVQAGTTTGIDGSYTLNAPDGNAILIFKYTGYSPMEIPLNGRSLLDVQLSVAQNLINEVVVIGYGTQKKSDLTGSVGSIKTKEI